MITLSHMHDSVVYIQSKAAFRQTTALRENTQPYHSFDADTKEHRAPRH